MVALTNVTFGSRAVSEQVNQIIRLLNGTSGTSQAVSLTQLDSSSVYSLTLKNLHTNSRTQQWLDSTGVSQGEFDYRGLRVTQLAVGATITAGGNPFLVSGSTADQNYQMASMEYGNHFVGTGDASTLRLIAALEQGATDMQHRALEAHTMVNASASTTTNREGILVSLNTAKASGSATGVIHNTIWAQASAVNWPSLVTSGAGVAVDNHILLGYDADGCQWYVRCIGTAGAGTPEHFRISGSTGAVDARTIRPFVTASYDLGTTGLLWNDAFITRKLTGIGTVGVPAWTFASDTDTGIYQTAATTNTLSIGTGGVEALRVSAGQLLDFVPATSFVALGGGAAPTLGTIGGAGPAAAGQRSWLKILEAGTPDFIPVWR